MSHKMTDEEYGLAAIAMRRALREIGGVTATAEAVGVSQQAVSSWTICPAHQVVTISRSSGVPEQELRPDIFRGE